MSNDERIPDEAHVCSLLPADPLRLRRRLRRDGRAVPVVGDPPRGRSLQGSLQRQPHVSPRDARSGPAHGGVPRRGRSSAEGEAVRRMGGARGERTRPRSLPERPFGAGGGVGRSEGEGARRLHRRRARALPGEERQRLRDDDSAGPCLEPSQEGRGEGGRIRHPRLVGAELYASQGLRGSSRRLPLCRQQEGAGSRAQARRLVSRYRRRT